jgi:hypothetical protein
MYVSELLAVLNDFLTKSFACRKNGKKSEKIAYNEQKDNKKQEILQW